VNRRFRFGCRGSPAFYNGDTPFGSTFFAGASAVAQQRYTSGFKDYADVSAIVNELRGVQARA
jgi:hypothetical protein